MEGYVSNDRETPQPEEIELDEDFDEQKRKVDTWEEQMKKERDEREKTTSDE